MIMILVVSEGKERYGEAGKKKMKMSPPTEISLDWFSVPRGPPWRMNPLESFKPTK